MAFNLTIWEILGVLLFLIVVLVISANSLKFNGNTRSKFRGNNSSKFGNIFYNGNEIDWLQAKVNNSPDITFSYKTPDHYLGDAALRTAHPTWTDPSATQAPFAALPILFLAYLGATASSLSSLPTDVRMKASDLIAVPATRTATTGNFIALSSYLSIPPTIALTLAASSEEPTLITKNVTYTISGLTASILQPLEVGAYYTFGIAIQSSLSVIKTTNNDYYSSPYLTKRYGITKYKSVMWDGTNLVEVDPDGAILGDVSFGTLSV
jgi:hypothetical protein